MPQRDHVTVQPVPRRSTGGAATPDTCAACGPVNHCTSNLTCANSNDSQCTSCTSGFYVDNTLGPQTVCSTCPTVDHCAVNAGCTGPSGAQCTQCQDGFYLVDGVDDACPACTGVPHCISPLTCTIATDSHCTACASGYVLVGDTSCQEQCTVADCSNHGTPSSTGTRPDNCGCVCDVGWAGPACDAHVDFGPCTRADCSGHGDATGTRPLCTCTCDTGFLGASCATACTPIDSCTSDVTCTNAGDSQCTSCAAGHHLVEGTADSCPANPVITDVPIAGNRTRLSDLPKKRQSQISSYDVAIDLMEVDPTVSGATLAIFSPTNGTTYSLDLPVSQWQGPLPGRRFRFAARGNPAVKILLVNGRQLRIELRGSGAYPLGTPQGSVGMTLTIGTTRFCNLFGPGTIQKDNGVRFVARKAPRPGACPIDPADNQPPVAQPNAYQAGAATVAAGSPSGEYVVGNVRDDAGPLVDSDPEGDAFTVESVLNPTLTAAGAPVTLAEVIPPLGTFEAYQFTLNGKIALFTIARDGTLALGGDPNVFGNLTIGENATFEFDYTDVDTFGHTSNAAHVSFVVNGSNTGCIVGGRC